MEKDRQIDRFLLHQTRLITSIGWSSTKTNCRNKKKLIYKFFNKLQKQAILSLLCWMEPCKILASLRVRSNIEFKFWDCSRNWARKELAKLPRPFGSLSRCWIGWLTKFLNPFEPLQLRWGPPEHLRTLQSFKNLRKSSSIYVLTACEK